MLVPSGKEAYANRAAIDLLVATSATCDFTGARRCQPALQAARSETAPDGVEMRVKRAKQVSPTPLGRCYWSHGKGRSSETTGARRRVMS